MIDWHKLDPQRMTPAEIRAVEGLEALGIDWARLEGRGQTFSPATTAGAIAAVAALQGRKKDPNKIRTFWDLPDKMPTITDVDFRDMKKASVPIDSLYASNKWLKRDRMGWHVRNPGLPMNPSVFTTDPIVLQTKAGNIILDGQHRLAALKLLGATKWPVFLLPSRI